MGTNIKLLDCTLRDGAYIVDSKFGIPAMKGIIKSMQDAKIDIIECGWLKDAAHEEGSSFFHVPEDVKQYMTCEKEGSTYVAMIDWNRYDTSRLPECDGTGIDAIRVVFPHGKHKEAVQVGNSIRKKGYDVYFQAANTLAYNENELTELAECMNEFRPKSVSVVDTFGAMFQEDLERIVKILDQKLEKEIMLGFHSHNNQQLSFALSIHFVEILKHSERDIIVDSSLCGMGRGAGNTTTELMANYLNRKHHGNYDMNVIMDAIDIYMESFRENYTWGYSTPYFIAGMYCCHVNNIAYLSKNHRTNTKDMRNIIGALSPEQRIQYDYDLLEQTYIQNQSRTVDDTRIINTLKEITKNRMVLLVAPGKSIETQKDKIDTFIRENHPIVIGVNAIHPAYKYDYLFFMNDARYHYAKQVYGEIYSDTTKILLSNIKTQADSDEMIVNFNRVIKRGWEHFDNAVINCLRLLDVVRAKKVAIAGFDGFAHKYNESYADASLPTLNPDNKWDELNEEILDMFRDFKKTTETTMEIEFVTPSYFEG